MAYRESKATKALQLDLDRLYPDRSTVSDGWIGDAAHQSRESDHNPWVSDGTGVGVVTARDVTHDPDGPRGEWLAEIARTDSRCKYVIWDSRIASGGEGWRPYSGPNPHDRHVHVSVRSEPQHFDDPRSWVLAPVAPPSWKLVEMFLFTRNDPPASTRLFTSGSRRMPGELPAADVAQVQRALREAGYIARLSPGVFQRFVDALAP